MAILAFNLSAYGHVGFYSMIMLYCNLLAYTNTNTNNFIYHQILKQNNIS